jgi:predicted dienelactone hydrolase
MHVALLSSLRSSARRAPRLALLACTLAALCGACGGDDASSDAGSATDLGVDASAIDAGPPPEPRADYGVRGAFPVGNRRVVMDDGSGSRALPVELWYPATEPARAASEAGAPLADFERGTPHEARMAELVAASDPACLRVRTASAPAPAAVTRTVPWPLVVFSHCHVCTRFDVAEVAERLASHGIVVAAPDHEGNTLWDFEAGTAADVGSAFLAVRVRDVRRVLDRLLDGGAMEIPDDLRGRLDPARAGVMGHSFGGVTTGAVVAEEPRFVAALSIAAPISLLSGTRPSSVRTPYLLLLAREDNSITEAGNNVMRNDFRRLGGPAWLVEVDDAGHWSFSDIAGLGGTNFLAGCGTGTRQTVADETFEYLENGAARDLASDVAAAFFAIFLLDDPGGATTLARLPVPAHVSRR